MNTQILSPVGTLRGRRMARFFALALMTLIAGAAAAADFGDRTPSVADLVDALNVRSVDVGDQAAAARSDSVRTRGLKFVAHGESVAGSSASVAAPATKASAPLAGRVSLRIQFDLNSDRVLGGSANSLGNLAAALNSDALKGQRFAVIGHTDVTGSFNYNLGLSARRARSVAEFLSIAGVGLDRAKTVGRGPTDLLDSLPANAPQQRRVEIVMLD